MIDVYVSIIKLMAYTTLQDVINDINAKIIPNNVKEITGQELQDVLNGLAQFIGSSALNANLVAQLGPGGSVGGINTGDAFTIGTPLQTIITALLSKAIHPTYVLPTSVLSSSDTVFTKELGTAISPILNVFFTQNDAGAVISRSLTRNGTLISSTLPFTDSSSTVDTLSYIVATTYNQGPIKNNNLGAPDSVGRIAAGFVNSNSIVFLGKRKAFFGPSPGVPIVSSSVRSLPSFLLDPQVGSIFTISIPQGTTVICFAYPDTLQDPSSIICAELGGSDLKSLFTKNLVNVEGASSYAAISYKVFSFQPIEAYPTSVTYKITI